METTQKKTWWSPEFVLVLVMLTVLTALVAFLVFPSIPKSKLPPTDPSYLKDSEMYFQSTLEYRKNLLAIILTAFGAWVGAGAAYFFGRENLRESANSLLQLHQQMTGNAKLSLMKVRDIPPKPLDSNFSEDVLLKDVIDKLKNNPHMWFISTNVPTNGGWYILSEESIYQYIQKGLEDLSKTHATKIYSDMYDELMKKPLKDIVPEISKDTNFSRFVNQYADATLEDNAATINDEMDLKKVFLGIVKDDKGNLVQYFTTSDIRKALLKI